MRRRRREERESWHVEPGSFRRRRSKEWKREGKQQKEKKKKGSEKGKEAKTRASYSPGPRTHSEDACEGREVRWMKREERRAKRSGKAKIVRKSRR